MWDLIYLYESLYVTVNLFMCLYVYIHKGLANQCPKGNG